MSSRASLTSPIHRLELVSEKIIVVDTLAVANIHTKEAVTTRVPAHILIIMQVIPVRHTNSSIKESD